MSLNKFVNTTFFPSSFTVEYGIQSQSLSSTTELWRHVPGLKEVLKIADKKFRAQVTKNSESQVRHLHSIQTGRWKMWDMRFVIIRVFWQRHSFIISLLSFFSTVKETLKENLDFPVSVYTNIPRSPSASTSQKWLNSNGRSIKKCFSLWKWWKTENEWKEEAHWPCKNTHMASA